MATVYEAYNSRVVNVGWDVGDAALYFFLIGETDDAAARADFAAQIPSTFQGLALLTVEGIEHIGGGFWKATGKYGSPQRANIDGGFGDPGNPPPEPGDTGGPPEYSSDTSVLGSEFSFDISAQNEKIYISRATVASYPAIAAPDNKQLVGVTADGEVEGVDVLSPVFEFTVSVTVGFITRGYLQTLRDTVGTVNLAAFYGFNQGEVIFLGVSGQQKDANKITLTYKFGVRPNESFDLELVTGVETITKRGWEYVWVSYTNFEDVSQLVQRPKFAYVERLYVFGDFSALGIGG